MDFGEDFDNAFWNGEQMVFGNGGGGMIKENVLTTVFTAIAHELTHGVTQYTAHLTGNGEPEGVRMNLCQMFLV